MKNQSKRRLLQAALLSPLCAIPSMSWAAAPVRELRFNHLHTGEKLRVTYFENGMYLPDALGEIDVLLRDFRTEEVHPINPALLDYAHQIQTTSGSAGTFHIVSAYRSPKTNEMLRQRGGGVAKRSYHMRGEALDIRLSDVSAADVRSIATKLKLGGVGYYGSSDFVHIDIGRVRQW